MVFSKIKQLTTILYSIMLFFCCTVYSMQKVTNCFVDLCKNKVVQTAAVSTAVGTTAWLLSLSPADIPVDLQDCKDKVLAKLCFNFIYEFNSVPKEVAEKYTDKDLFVVPRESFETLYNETLYTKNVVKIPYYKKIMLFILNKKNNEQNQNTHWQAYNEQYSNLYQCQLEESYSSWFKENYPDAFLKDIERKVKGSIQEKENFIVISKKQLVDLYENLDILNFVRHPNPPLYVVRLRSINKSIQVRNEISSFWNNLQHEIYRK